jgi:phage-related protein
MFSEIQDFEVRLASNDGITSQIVDYIVELIDTNPLMANKAILNLTQLPFKIYTKQDVKPIVNNKAKLFELKVQSKNNICRFFFVIERPNVIVLYGFTKKTQKTDKKDLNAGIKAYEDYQDYKKTISFDLL